LRTKAIQNIPLISDELIIEPNSLNQSDMNVPDRLKTYFVKGAPFTLSTKENSKTDDVGTDVKSTVYMPSVLLVPNPRCSAFNHSA
jgi:hypothetical protein